jgi:hypothetical protein
VGIDLTASDRQRPKPLGRQARSAGNLQTRQRHTARLCYQQAIVRAI